MIPAVQLAMGLAQFAPQVIRWLSGSDKAGEVAEKVVAVAEAVTGQPGPKALAAMTADPALVLQFQERIAGMAHDLDKAYLADRADARARDVAYVAAGRTNKRANFMVAMDVVGLLVGLGGMLALGWLKAKHPDAISEGVFGALLAQLATITSFFGLCLRDAHQFEFGSSRGSADKTELLVQQKGGGK